MKSLGDAGKFSSSYLYNVIDGNGLLPSTFLTGLFGVNLGGIPGAGGNSDFQFFVFC